MAETKNRVHLSPHPRQSIAEAVLILRQHRAYYASRVEQYDYGLSLLEELQAMDGPVGVPEAPQSPNAKTETESTKGAG